MPFTFNCPSCQIELEAQDEWENLETVCPQCGKNIPIRRSPSFIPESEPAPGADAEPVSSADAAGNFLFICPECGYGSELAAGRNGSRIECPNCAELVTSVPAVERPCPFCGEKIRLKARVCKHCQKHVPPFSASSDTPESLSASWTDAAGARIRPAGDSIVEKIFHRFAVTAAPFFVKQELRGGPESEIRIGPLTCIMLFLLVLFFAAGCALNIYGLSIIRHAIPGGGVIFSVVCFLSIAGSVNAYRRKEVYTPILSGCMWIAPVATLLSRQPGAVGLTAAALSVPGSMMFSFTSIAMAGSMLLGKSFRFDKLNQTAFITYFTTVVVMAVLGLPEMEDVLSVVVALLTIILLLGFVCRLYLLAYLMVGRTPSERDAARGRAA